MKEDLVVLFSGGADSMLLLEMAKEMGRKPYALIMDYEQLHKEEIGFAIEYCMNNRLMYQVVGIQGLNVNSALTGDGTKGKFDGVSIWNVPGRNTMFLSVAFSVAENKDIQEIWYGPDYSDREGLFPDCYQDYVYRVNQLFEVAGVKPIKVYAPLMGMTKEMILKLLELKGITKQKMFSGYGNL